jgi:hypothetical protein
MRRRRSGGGAKLLAAYGWAVMASVFVFTDCQKQHRSAPLADARRAAPTAGQPLSTSVRAEMEPRFGHDFSQVRVHADGAAAGAAESRCATSVRANSRASAACQS